MKRTRLLRMLCAFAFILLVFLGLILHTGSGTLSAIGWRDIAAVCPLGALEAMLAEKTLIPRAILGALAVVAFCLILGRVFCGWICPVPFIKQLFGQEEHACESPSEKKAVNHTALQHRCVIPLRVIKDSSGRTAASPSTTDTAQTKSAESAKTAAVTTNIKSPKGPFMVLAGALASSAAFGFPVFCLICPVGLTFALVIALWRLAEFNELSWSIAIFAGFLFLEVFVLRRWCRSFCPLGAVMTLLSWGNRTFRIRSTPNACLRKTGLPCEVCRSVCPEGLNPTTLETTDLASARCTKCRICIDACPSQALQQPFFTRSSSVIDTLSNRRPLLRAVREMPTPAPAQQRRQNFNPVDQTFSQTAAVLQASRCISCGACVEACPQGNSIPSLTAALREERLRNAALLMLRPRAFPEVCGRVCPSMRLCESVCPIPADLGGPVPIAALERFAADYLLDSGWDPWPLASNGKRVAIVGAGPSGLACADVLARQGVNVTVFERDSEIGGLLTFGIPSFKLEHALISHRRRMLERLGICFRLSTAVGRDISIKNLLQNFDAIFIGIGAEFPVTPNLPGLDGHGVVWARPWLAHVAGAHLAIPGFAPLPDLSTQRVLVLGSGDTAVDCLRTALRLGADAPTAICRRSLDKLRALHEEVAAAQDEGARFMAQVDAIRITHRTNGSIAGLVIRSRVDGIERILPADLLIIACGFRAKPAAWLLECGVTFNMDGQIMIDNHRTANPKIFAGGDAVRGADLAVRAFVDGRDAAEEILRTFTPNTN